MCCKHCSPSREQTHVVFVLACCWTISVLVRAARQWHREEIPLKFVVDGERTMTSCPYGNSCKSSPLTFHRHQTPKKACGYRCLLFSRHNLIHSISKRRSKAVERREPCGEVRFFKSHSPPAIKTASTSHPPHTHTFGSPPLHH